MRRSDSSSTAVAAAMGSGGGRGGRGVTAGAEIGSGCGLATGNTTEVTALEWFMYVYVYESSYIVLFGMQSSLQELSL